MYWQWNSISQDKNPTETFNLFSHGKFCDVDDHYDHYEHLSRYLSESVLNKCNANGVPTHKLILKVDDKCLITEGSNCINFQKSHQCWNRITASNQISWNSISSLFSNRTLISEFMVDWQQNMFLNKNLTEN